MCRRFKLGSAFIGCQEIKRVRVSVWWRRGTRHLPADGASILGGFDVVRDQTGALNGALAGNNKTQVQCENAHPLFHISFSFLQTYLHLLSSFYITHGSQVRGQRMWREPRQVIYSVSLRLREGGNNAAEAGGWSILFLQL